MNKFIYPKFKNYIFIFLISIIISGLIIFSIQKYETRSVNFVVSPKSSLFYYKDLDNDGNSEKIEYLLGYNDKLGIIIYTKGKLIEQWNFSGNWAKTNFPFYADYDKDGIQEVFIFTVLNDSIYMHCLDPFSKKVKIRNKAICRVYKENGKYDFKISPCSAYDVNNDGYQEVFFSIETTYSIKPRNMFAYYPANDTVIMSPESCSLVLFPKMLDIDNDSIPEFISNITFATGNCELDVKYTDQYSWLMIFTPEMKFKFPPLKHNLHPSVSWFVPISYNGKIGIIILSMYRGTENLPCILELIDSNGQIVKTKNLHFSDIENYNPLFLSNNEYKYAYILQNNGTIIRVDSMLNFTNAGKFENITNNYIVQKKDIDCDGEDEFILPGKKRGELIIYRNDFSNPVCLKLYENSSVEQISIIKKNGDKPKIFIDTTVHLYTFYYGISSWYIYRYVIFIPVIIFLLFLNFLIQKIKHYQQLKIKNTQKQISELQIKSIQNQLDPHFTLNIFGSFANLINEKDTERAEYIFTKYTGLLKSCLINSDNIFIKLQEELDFVTSYIELEKFRYSGKFSFKIDLSKDVDKQMIIPKMLIHIFTENAIKHGLRHIDIAGKLIITGIKENGQVFISIIDNGIGRKKAKEYNSFSTGKGLNIIDKILKYNYELNKIKISYQIIDLYDNNKASGTKVKICIPVSVLK